MNKIYYKQTKPNYKSSTLQAFPKKAEKDLTEAYSKQANQRKQNSTLHSIAVEFSDSNLRTLDDAFDRTSSAFPPSFSVRATNNSKT